MSGTRALACLAIAVLSASSALAQGVDASLPGEVLVQPPTFQALGLEWPLQGDANRNASVTIRYRLKGADAWRDGLPPLRIGGEETKYLALDFTPPAMFAGSLFNLQPDSLYEIVLKICRSGRRIGACGAAR